MDDQVMTANQLWKSSDTSLAFKDWISQEKEKNVFIKNDTLSTIVDDSKKATGVALQDPSKNPNNKILGINKNVVYISAAVIVLAMGYSYYKSK